MDLQIEGRVALLTGASKGIGLAAARLFATEGATVVISARGEAALAAAAADIERATGRRVDTVPADVTRVADLDRLSRHMKERHGRCDILVNNAGTGTYKPFLDVTDEELTEGMAINFFAQFRLSQRIVPMMIATGGGAIVNVSGRTSMQTAFPPGSTCTGPAKAAENRFTTDLADELKQHRIRVNCVVPGVVVTPDRFEKWEREAMGDAWAEAAALALRTRILADMDAIGQHWGTAEEVADTIAYLASPRSQYVTGTTLLVDGSAKLSYTRVIREYLAGRNG